MGTRGRRQVACLGWRLGGKNGHREGKQQRSRQQPSISLHEIGRLKLGLKLAAKQEAVVTRQDITGGVLQGAVIQVGDVERDLHLWLRKRIPVETAGDFV